MNVEAIRNKLCGKKSNKLIVTRLGGTHMAGDAISSGGTHAAGWALFYHGTRLPGTRHYAKSTLFRKSS